MRKKILLLIGIILISISITPLEVNAKDTVYSINKYTEEKFNFIKDSYKEDKKDGFVIAGTYLKEEIKKEENVYKDYQVMLVKYNKKGNIIWSYQYGNTKEDKLYDLTYTYNEEHKIDGYLLVVENTYDVLEEENILPNKVTFIKVDLDGKEESIIESELSDNSTIKKIITTKKDNEVTGYTAIGTVLENEKEDTTFIVHYNLELKKEYYKENKNKEKQEIYIDITPIYENNTTTSYILIKETYQKDKLLERKLIKENLEMNSEEEINSNLNQYVTANLKTTETGYLLFGLTKEVKLEKGKTSYYIISYDKDNKELWEVIGDIPISNKHNIRIQTIKEEENTTGYYLMYQNSTDSSYEVIELDNEGLFKKKLKKIKNNYYDFENYYVKGKIIYFIGQINCPDDDNCDYDNNSLFLVSDEDKVIEVKDKDSKNIIIGFIIFILIITIGILLGKRRKRLN